MSHDLLAAFGAGLLTMGFAVASLFFFRFRRKTGDSLFAFFGLAFLLMAASQALSVLLHVPSEDQAGIYLLRLAAYGIIMVAVLSKNLRH